MRFYTRPECEEWCDVMGIPMDEHKIPSREFESRYVLECPFPKKIEAVLYFCRAIEQALQPRSHCFIWMTETGVWPSSENLHLFYRLRQSYGENRLVSETPGHLCLGFEQADLITLMQLAILFAWDAHAMPVTGYARAFISHDEYVVISSDSKEIIKEAKKSLADLKPKVYHRKD